VIGLRKAILNPHRREAMQIPPRLFWANGENRFSCGDGLYSEQTGEGRSTPSGTSRPWVYDATQ
jgi:hypothetical protein